MIDKIFFHLVARWFLLFEVFRRFELELEDCQKVLQFSEFCSCQSAVRLANSGQCIVPHGREWAVRSWERAYGAKP